MVLEAQAIRYRAFNDWIDSSLGTSIATALSDQLAQQACLLTGEVALQLGSFGQNHWLRTVSCKRLYFITPYFQHHFNACIASMHLLPIAPQHVHCVIAPFSMEIFQHKQFILQEIDRVLKPMGFAVFLGINPISLWGMALKWGKLSCLGAIPTKLTSSFSIKRWLLAEGYQCYWQQGFYYVPPIANARMRRYFVFLNEMGKIASPLPANFYCLIMQKTAPCTTGLIYDVSTSFFHPRKSAFSPSA